MSTFIVFILSLVLVIAFFVLKSVELSSGRRIFLTTAFEKSDVLILRFLLKLKAFVKKINFRNLRLIFIKLMVNIRKEVTIIKRRLDHQQSHFFTKREIDPNKSKNSPSFFLKNVSDYKKTLREEKKDK